MARKQLSSATRKSQLSDMLQELQSRAREYAGREFSDVDSLAPAVACALPVFYRHRESFKQNRSWLTQGEDHWTSIVLSTCDNVSDADWTLAGRIAELAKESAGETMLWHLYELLLAAEPARKRLTTGTFYTPPEMANYIVATVDRKLRDQFACREGLLDEQAGLILEPACGSGVFLCELLEHVLSHSGSPPQAAARLLPRLVGIDISPVPLLITGLRMAMALSARGVELTGDVPGPNLICGNALAGPGAIAALSQPIGVVLGNPPFSSLSTNEQPWIQSLIRGTHGESGYLSIDGQALGEKKTWLHDDYVKFLRLAQWCIERNGSGVISFVTNHGWLDNATFRIARQQLLRALPEIEIVDLHGNFKKQEVSPGDDRDENVFGLSQGIAIATLTKRPDEISGGRGSCRAAVPRVSYAELWGSRAGKLQRLPAAASTEPFAAHDLNPTAPWFNFVPQQPIPAEYLAAPLLTEIMPVNSTAPVTARDHFVIAGTRDELIERLADFCNAQLNDDELRRKYFQRTRSSRYERGDTRGWKLTDVRQTLMSEADPARFIRRCLYRPFVWRYVIWHPALIDWPRPEFTRHFSGDETQSANLALLARRQSSAGKERNFFWITDCLPLDGVIRSDNRGSESFFPLWLRGDSDRLDANLELAENLGREPRDWLNYLYALFHSPTYRTRYTAGLAQEFPRVLFPVSDELFIALSGLGGGLIQLHLADPHDVASEDLHSRDSQNEQASAEQIEAFRVGTYNVCRKWLQMESESPDSPAYLRLRQLIARTISLQRLIDTTIDSTGGFPAAFRTGWEAHLTEAH